jgi:prepilin-type N-terminal cleavage/methylation domain-containing protein
MIQQRRDNAFTLVEMLVSITILTLIVLLVSRLFNSASALTTSGNKRMDVDSQARPLLNRMGIDFAQMVKRPDVDYFVKSAGTQTGNDQIAFYSVVPGYNATAASPLSLVAYRINSQNKAERMGKGLIWNGDSSTGTPMVFLPLTITANWVAATNNSVDVDYELTAPNVFRFEYYYVLNNGNLSDTPWDTVAGHSTPSGFRDVAAFSVAIAAIDPKSRVLLDNSSQVAPPNDNITKLVGKLVDYAQGMAPGQLITNWQDTLNNNSSPDPEITAMPRPAISGIRIYERHFQLAPRS